MRTTHGRRIAAPVRTLTVACLAAGLSTSAVRGPHPPKAIPAPARAPADPLHAASRAMVAVAAMLPPVHASAPPFAAQPAPAATAPEPPVSDYGRLRAQLRWLPVRVGGRMFATPDGASRLLLARSAAQRAGLADVGLDYRDVYGVISAETTWVPRTGMGRNGVASHGLAQFEPATARALGVRQPDDAVEAVHGAATLLKEAAQWSARRIAGLGLSGAERTARLREGVSIYYNLSSRARARWSGVGASGLPVETQRHIANMHAGVRQAERLHAAGGAVADQVLLAEAMAAVRAAPPESVVVRTSAPPQRAVATPAAARRAAPQPVGSIAWSRRDGERQVVWSDGSVTREPGARVRWTGRSPG